jgi:hypothetical protein
VETVVIVETSRVIVCLTHASNGRARKRQRRAGRFPRPSVLATRQLQPLVEPQPSQT